MPAVQALRTDAYRLLHNGMVALSEIEQTGICIDNDYYRSVQRRLEHKKRALLQQLDGFPEVQKWRTVFGDSFNIDSSTQLSSLLFDHLGVKSEKLTKGGSLSVDAEALRKIDLPFLKVMLEMRKIDKVLTTYLPCFMREEVDGLIHPIFNLHTVITYRSSSDSPNFQNIPSHDAEVTKLVRDGFVARAGHVLMEADYSGLEVRIAACYHKDPVMLQYIHDETSDMHRDMACQCFCLPEEECSKKLRFAAKSFFVFAQFYGDYYKNCAKNMWETVKKEEPSVSGKPVGHFLRKQGIRTYDEFERHLGAVERDFWDRRFRVYDKWRKKWFEAYQRHGYFDSLTGFRYSGSMRRNETINYPIQGSAFHCLLWSLITLHKWLRRAKMGARIVGQIHDSIVLDVPEEEVPKVLVRLKEISCQEIRKEWDWIIVPLDVEIKVSPVNGSWYECKEIKS